jgi:uncharacterized metal-binding protein YceD (DUF177 family)
MIASLECVLISNMRFRLHKLVAAPIGARQYEQINRGETWLDDDLHLAYLKCDLTFTHSNDRILADGTIDTAVELQCVRSLNLFDLPLTIHLEDVAYAIPGAYSPVTGEDPMPKLDSDLYINVKEAIREAIIMALPINPISPQYQNEDALETLIDDKDKEWLTIKWANEK